MPQESIIISKSVYVKTSASINWRALNNAFIYQVFSLYVFGSSNDGTQCQCATQSLKFTLFEDVMTVHTVKI